jgi:hypothetical protein
MADKIIIGNISKGQETALLPFNIDNDAFPYLYNAYTWRGRVKRKRGTILLGQTQFYRQSAAAPNNWQLGSLGTLDGSGNATVNLLTAAAFSAPVAVALGSLSLSDGTNTYTDNSLGAITGSPAGSGTINYVNGVVTITGGAHNATLTGSMAFNVGSPIMGLEDFVSSSFQFPLMMVFDTSYSYQVNAAGTALFNTNYYKNSNNLLLWSGANYQQFWTTNFQGALWATNGKPGFHFKTISSITTGNPTTITTTTNHGLITGDFVWFNEVTGADAALLNLQTASITRVDNTNFTVTANTTGKTVSGGIFEELTQSVSATLDGIRWYDGDPTSNTGLPVGNALGWVNFSPPITSGSAIIADQTSGQYYLVGATAMVPYKDRLLFFGPWIQTSTGSAIQLQDTVLWSWNGSPYYTTTGTAAPYTTVNVPAGMAADPSSWYVNVTGKGGYLSAGISQAITTLTNNEDVLLVGFTNKQTKLVYSGNDLDPFAFYSINSEYGSSSTFSSITLDRTGIGFGVYGLTATTQESTQRIDLQIPTQIFSISYRNNSVNRVSAARDYYHEWLYFSYVPESSKWVYPTQTLQYNYRENSWSVHYENFTTMGRYFIVKGYTWATLPFNSWATWSEPWSNSISGDLFPNVVCGTPQGFVLIKGEGTGEAQSCFITSIASNGGAAQLSSANHCMKTGDYIYIQNCLGATALNNTIAKIVTVDSSSLVTIDAAVPSGTYIGGGTFAKLSQPLIQTKQFPVYWQQGKQVRLGVQRYLMDNAPGGQVTVNIYLSENPDVAWNAGSLVPSDESQNNSLIYSQTMSTAVETNNLQSLVAQASTPYQIWHRMNTSLIGDTFQIGITLSDAQMKNLTQATAEIALHGMVLDVAAGPMLA